MCDGGKVWEHGINKSIWRQSHFLHYTVDVWTQTLAYLHCAVVLSAFLCVNSLRLDKRRDDRLTRRLQMVQWERGLTQEVSSDYQSEVQLSLSLDWSATRAKNLTLYKGLDLFLPAQRQTHVKIPTAGVFNLSADSCADRVSAAHLSNNGRSSRCFSLGTNAPYSSAASYPTSVCNSLYFHVTPTSSTASRIRSPLQPGCPPQMVKND